MQKQEYCEQRGKVTSSPTLLSYIALLLLSVSGEHFKNVKRFCVFKISVQVVWKNYLMKCSGSLVQKKIRLMNSHAHTLTRSHAHTLTRSHAYTLTRSHAHTLTRSHAHTLTRSHAHTLTRSHAHTLTRSHAHHRHEVRFVCLVFQAPRPRSQKKSHIQKGVSINW